MRPERTVYATRLPHIDVLVTDDGSRTLRDRRIDETFHSGCGALSECLHVYLNNSGTHVRLQTRQPTRILELGFGTGMGWLLTATAASVAACPLDYTSVETELLPADVLAQVDIAGGVEHAIASGWLMKEFALVRSIEERWLHRRQLAPPGSSLTFEVDAANRLQLIAGDVRDVLESPGLLDTESFDAIYFDAFSPGSSPELWTEELFARVRQLLASHGRLVSYCVSGAVRRNLENAGFSAQRLPGPPGGKREVLVGHPR